MICPRRALVTDISNRVMITDLGLGHAGLALYPAGLACKTEASHVYA